MASTPTFSHTLPAALGAHGGVDPWAEFRVDHPRELSALLRQLRDAAAPVSLNAPDGRALQTSVWAVDEERRRLSLAVDADRPELPAMVDVDELVAVAYLDAVKLQFDLHDLVVVRGAAHAALQAALPPVIYRFQRRNAYRVRTAERSAPTAILRHPSLPDMTLLLRVIDVSIGGCALFVGADVPSLPPGTRIDGVWIELDGDTRFEVDLLLHHVTSLGGAAGDPGGVRVGCEWDGLCGDAERALQRYIDQTQKRRRLLTLD
jgi:c-di-GMP-binding flagellar brake protein YcgR